MGKRQIHKSQGSAIPRCAQFTLCASFFVCFTTDNVPGAAGRVATSRIHPERSGGGGHTAERERQPGAAQHEGNVAQRAGGVSQRRRANAKLRDVSPANVWGFFFEFPHKCSKLSESRHRWSHCGVDRGGVVPPWTSRKSQTTIHNTAAAQPPVIVSGLQEETGESGGRSEILFFPLRQTVQPFGGNLLGQGLRCFKKLWKKI